MFSIPDDPEITDDVIMLDDVSISDIDSGEPYLQTFVYMTQSIVSPDEFWAIVYPPMEAAA